MRACNQFTILVILAAGASYHLYLGSLLEKFFLSKSLFTKVNEDCIENSAGLCVVLSYYIIALNTYTLPGTQFLAVFAGMKFGFYEAVLLG